MTTAEKIVAEPKPQNRRVCFSFAAYAKAVIEHLRACGIPVTAGLSEPEFAAIESDYGFEFPPDLRSILREGLPIGAGFPNWRSSSPQQLRILLALPVSGLLHEVSKSGFWYDSWGPRPASGGERLDAAKAVMDKAPVLVPIYRHSYISSLPNLAGNPIFHVRGGDVRCSGFDIADFFQREECQFHPKSSGPAPAPPTPAWAAKSARRVEVWTDLAEGDTWIRSCPPRGTGLEGSLKEMGWRLREGGWGEEEVREMLMEGSDGGDDGGLGDRMVLRDRESVMWHVRLLALALLRAGWSSDDVVYSMGCPRAEDDRTAPVTWQVDPTLNEISIEL